jgi:hypothetical protein
MRPPIDAFDNGISGTLKFIVQTPFRQAPEHAIDGPVAVQGEGGNVGLPTGSGHRPVHGLDDVPSDRQVAQGLLCIGPERPAAWSDLVGKTKPFKLGDAASHEPTEIGRLTACSWAEVGDTSCLVRHDAKDAVQSRPALGFNFPRERRVDFSFTARAKFQRDPLGGSGTKASADVIAADHEILLVISPASDQDVDVRIVRVPVIDGDPVKFCAEVALCIVHELAGKGSKIGHLCGVLRRHRETEMVSVVLASVRESLAICVVRSRIEHLGIAPVSRNTVAFQVGDVFGQRCRPETLATMANHPAHDDNTSAWVAQR